ncbi:MAG TPA: DUF3592 domain-containing protein [Phycisphaerales bacterium]|nr:DUF3592 domain-containing protein [Phycisphaerales bacterium]
MVRRLASNAIAPGLLLCMAVAVLWLDLRAVGPMIEQVRALGYSMAEGTVLLAGTDWARDGKRGRSGQLGIKIVYRYEVGGQVYTGQRYRYGLPGSEAEAEAVVSRHGIGEPVRVWYDPENPRSAMLAPGLNHWDWRKLLFLLPWNVGLVMVCFAALGSAGVHLPAFVPDGRGVPRWRQGTVGVRSDAVAPVCEAGLALCVVGVLGSIVVAFVPWRLEAVLVGVAWGVVGVVGVGTWVRARVRLRRPRGVWDSEKGGGTQRRAEAREGGGS